MSVAAEAELEGMSDAEVVEAYLTASMIPDPTVTRRVPTRRRGR